MSLINKSLGWLSPGLQYITSISRKSLGMAGDREMLTYDKVTGRNFQTANADSSNLGHLLFFFPQAPACEHTPLNG